MKGVKEHFIVVEQRLKEMDAMAIDMEILSINPFWYRKERDTAEAICKINNEKLAELCAQKPDRFGAFASLPMQAPDLAAQMLETAMKKQGLKGAAIGGSVLGDDFANRNIIPCWRRPKSSAPCCSSIRRARRSLRRVQGQWLARRTRSAIRSTPRSRCRS